MAKMLANHAPDGEYNNNDIRILGFTEHEIELILMSVQCIKPSKRFAVGWEVGMKDFADLANTSVSDARTQWKNLSSRLMKLPRLPRKSPSAEQHHESVEVIEDCILVKDEADNLSSAADSDEREAKDEVKKDEKGKQVAKPSALDDPEFSFEVEDSIGVTNEFQVNRKGNEVAEPSNIEDRTKKAWADVGDGMTEEKWVEMGDDHAL